MLNDSDNASGRRKKGESIKILTVNLGVQLNGLSGFIKNQINRGKICLKNSTVDKYLVDRHKGDRKERKKNKD